MLIGFQLRGGFFSILIHKGRGSVRPAKLPRKRVKAESFYLLEFLLALLKLLAGLKLQSEILSEWNHASIAVSGSLEQQPANFSLLLLQFGLVPCGVAPARKSLSGNWNLLYSRSCSLGRPFVRDRVSAPPARGTTVKDDWRAWLPEEKDQVFRAYVRQLEISYNMLSVSLDEALELRQGGRMDKASLAVCVAPDLCNRFAHPLVALLWSLSEHSKHYGTIPNAAPLDPANFQGARGQRAARVSGLLCRVLFSERTQFLSKLSTLGEMVDDLNHDFCTAAKEIACRGAEDSGSRWQAVYAAHYDLNTW